MFKDTMEEIMSQLESFGPYFDLDYINDNSGNAMASITVDGKFQIDELELATKMFQNYPEFAPTSTVKDANKIVYYFKEDRDLVLDENKKKKMSLLSPKDFKKKLFESKEEQKKKKFILSQLLVVNQEFNN